MLSTTLWRFLVTPRAPGLSAAARRVPSVTRSLLLLALSALPLLDGRPAVAQQFGPQPVIHKVEGANQRIEMIVNTSRLLTLDTNIPRAQVSNEEIVELTAVSPTQIQMLAKKPGVTQVNLWDVDDEIHTIDVIVYGDAQELSMLLKSRFPKSSLTVVPLASSVLIDGYVDDPAQVDNIIKIAEDYHPKVINNIRVGGVQQVLLQVRVMEVSRTKLRSVGMDWANISSSGDFVFSSVSGLLAAVSNTAQSVTTTGGETFAFGIVEPGNSFFAILELLQQRNLAKILAEPNVVALSGRPAFFNSGGEFPILVPQSLGTVSIQYKKFGTQVDFVPIVLGNGGIRLEVRPRVSEIDDSRSVVINNTSVPGLRVREVDTGVEMRAGQTLAIAGLVQTRTEAQVRGLPWVSDLPYVGAAFRKVREQTNEIELLVLVTPQLVEAMDPHEVPPCGPGLESNNPTDVELYLRGYIETPNCGPCGAGIGGSIGPAAGVPPGLPYHEETEIVPAPEPSAPLPPLDRGASRPREAPRSTARTLRLPTPSTGTSPPVVVREGPAPAVERRSSSRRLSQQNRQDRNDRLPSADSARRKPQPSFIGPVGYDVEK